MYSNLTNSNFDDFALEHYTNPYCIDKAEFLEDLKRIRYIKRLFKKYKQSGDIKEQLVLNHLVIIYNVFDNKAATRMLILKLQEYLDCLKPFLILLSYWDDPQSLGRINGAIYLDTNIDIDPNLVKILRKI